MGWITKVRGDSKAPIAADYECEACGWFALTVSRPAPDTQPCPTCSAPAPWRFPMPHGRVKPGEIVKGKVMEYPPESVCLDTRPLADGVPYHEWKAKQGVITRDLGLKRSRAGRR